LTVQAQVNHLLASGLTDLISSHWSIVLTVGLLFFALQLALCFRFFRWLRRHELTLASLNQEIENGGDGRRNIFDQGVANDICALRRRQDKIPVNTVGLGNYFDQDVGTFLRTVANITGGTFLRR
jgi:hypothetical protein